MGRGKLYEYILVNTQRRNTVASSQRLDHGLRIFILMIDIGPKFYSSIPSATHMTLRSRLRI